MKPNQAEFEKAAAAELERKQWIAMMSAAASAFCASRFKSQHNYVSVSVVKEIVERFGSNEKSTRCLDYIIETVINSGRVNGAYSCYDAVSDTWKVLETHLNAGLDLETRTRSTPHHLQLVVSH